MPGFGRSRQSPDPSDGRVLAVADDVLLEQGPTSHDPDLGRHVHGFADIDAGLLDDIDPGVVIAPLVARDFDATDLLQRLVALGYGGRVVFIADTALNRDLLADELRAIAPGQEIEVVNLGDV